MNRMKLSGSLIALIFLVKITIAQTPCVNGMAGPYPCNNVDLLAFVPLSEMGAIYNTNDIWGWVSPVTGKEYALVGCRNGTSFLDISDPTQPLYLGMLPTHTFSSLWRDLETYDNYCFIGSEADGHGLQVFNLLQLDNVSNPPQTFSETAHYAGFGNSHTITVDTLNGYLYANGTGTYSGGLHIVDISNPLIPTLAGGFSLEGYTHDCFVWNSYDGPDSQYTGKQIVFACNNNKLAIVDCTDKTDCESLGAYNYVDLGYVHQGWVTKDKKHFVLNDELDERNNLQGSPIGTRTHIFNIEDLDELIYMGFHEADNSAIDHNMYVKDQFVYESNYTSGLRIFDASKISQGILNEVAFFDLYPDNDIAEFYGTWSNYAFLPSGVNIATSMHEGLFITRPNLIVPSQTSWDLCGEEEISFELNIRAQLSFPLTLGITGIEGALINNITINQPGTYNINLTNLQDVTVGNYSPKLLLQTNFDEEYEVQLSVLISGEQPQTPTLINVPNEGSVDGMTSETFTWTSVSGASHYQIQVSQESDFATTIIDQTVTTNAYGLWVEGLDGLYYWRVRAINECGEGEWSEAFNFGVIAASVGEVSRIQLSIYPIPAESQLHVFANQPIQKWSITDLSGRMLLESQTQQNQLVVDVQNLASGIYLLKAGNSVTRFVKQ